MEAEGLEELVYSGPDFPEELDEFLAYGVREREGDFEVDGVQTHQNLQVQQVAKGSPRQLASVFSLS